MTVNFIIYADSFDINCGGGIVLHQLCHLLRNRNYDSYIWPKPRIFINKKNISLNIIRKFLKDKTDVNFFFYQHFNTPLAKYRHLKDAIVIYPEIIDGNPLEAKKVVRWLLHKPGFHTGRVNFSKNELVIGYGEECSGSNYIINEKNKFFLKFILKDIYLNNNKTLRIETCYMVRKGAGKKFIHPMNAICIDNMTHIEISEIFNKCKYFYSYDPYTYYSNYAIMCGCVSVVVPDEGVTKEIWYKNEQDRWGKAYGFTQSELIYAEETKDLFLNSLIEQEKINNENIDKFINICLSYFES